MLAGIELPSPRQRALGLLRSLTLEQRANLTVGPSILGRHRHWKPPEQGYHSRDVLACPGKVWERLIVLGDPLIHIMGQGMCAPPFSMALDLSLELHAFLLKLESCFLKLLVPGLQLLHP